MGSLSAADQWRLKRMVPLLFNSLWLLCVGTQVSKPVSSSGRSPSTGVHGAPPHPPLTQRACWRQACLPACVLLTHMHGRRPPGDLGLRYLVITPHAGCHLATSVSGDGDTAGDDLGDGGLESTAGQQASYLP